MNILTDVDISSICLLQKKILSYFILHSPSIQIYAEEAINYFAQGDEIDQYKKAKKHLNELFPNIEIMFEKIIHNYLIFEQFPFSKDINNIWSDFISLSGVFLFIKYITLGYMGNRFSLNDFVDVISASFRLINHSNFYRIINQLLLQENIMNLEQLSVLIKF